MVVSRTSRLSKKEKLIVSFRMFGGISHASDLIYLESHAKRRHRSKMQTTGFRKNGPFHRYQRNDAKRPHRLKVLTMG